MGSHSGAVWVRARESIILRRSSSLGIPLSEKAPSVKRKDDLYPGIPLRSWRVASARKV